MKQDRSLRKTNINRITKWRLTIKYDIDPTVIKEKENNVLHETLHTKGLEFS